MGERGVDVGQEETGHPRRRAYPSAGNGAEGACAASKAPRIAERRREVWRERGEPRGEHAVRRGVARRRRE